LLRSKGQFLNLFQALQRHFDWEKARKVTFDEHSPPGMPFDLWKL
jgi:hypothetical protein